MAIVSSRTHCGGPTTSTPFPSLTEQDFFEFEVGNEKFGEECKMKIMSVELAMKRESEYKRKFEMFQLDHQNEEEESSVPVQETPSRINIGADCTLLSEKMLCTQPSQLPQSSATGIIQARPSENTCHLSLPQEQQSYSSKVQVQSAESLRCIPPPQLQQSNAKEPGQIKPSQNLSHLPPPKPLQMQPSQNLTRSIPSQIGQPCAHLTLQSQPPRNFSQLPPPHCNKPFTMNPIQNQPPQNHSQLPPPHCKQPFTMNPIQNQPPQNFSQLPPPNCKQPFTMNSIQNQSPQNLSQLAPLPPPQNSSHLAPPQYSSQLAPPQLQYSQTQSNIHNQLPMNSSCVRPTQFRQHTVKRTRPIQPISLVCQACQVPCSSAVTLRQHCKGRKHKARVEELRLRKQFTNQQVSVSTQNTVIEPLWCSICKIRCMNEDCFQQHLNGQKHLSCLQAINSL